ncbi:MAG: adenosylcobinamide-phosphate synthase CbiB [Marinosulfonomonas sp.]|nr:adenosylcobinamide-phosphate synthase CbiB [Marinosulfonomonas sp.]
MSHATILLAALFLDALLGEPKWIWDRLTHPAILMGRAVGGLDAWLNKGRNKRLKGVFATALLSGVALVIGMLLAALPGDVIELIAATILLAHRSLADHVRAVAKAVRISTAEGRKAVARIVGRDTGEMTDNAIARATIESGAENFSDGVIAPAFWFLVAGLPGLLTYKIINTADSMIGYKTPRHAEFGWAAARLDDLVNWIPARLTALLIALAHFHWPDWRNLRADARKHRSPNAGWPEAAMAGVLDVALAGPRSYHGTAQELPFVNPKGRHTIAANEIDACVWALWRSWVLTIGLVLLLAVA